MTASSILGAWFLYDSDLNQLLLHQEIYIALPFKIRFVFCYFFSVFDILSFGASI